MHLACRSPPSRHYADTNYFMQTACFLGQKSFAHPPLGPLPPASPPACIPYGSPVESYRCCSPAVHYPCCVSPAQSPWGSEDGSDALFCHPVYPVLASPSSPSTPRRSYSSERSPASDSSTRAYDAHLRDRFGYQHFHNINLRDRRFLRAPTPSDALDRSRVCHLSRMSPHERRMELAYALGSLSSTDGHSSQTGSWSFSSCDNPRSSSQELSLFDLLSPSPSL